MSVSHVTYSSQGVPEGRVGVLQCREVASGTLTRSFAFSELWSITVYVCLVRWIYGLYYLVLTKVTLTKWSSGLERFLQRNCRLKVLIMQAQVNNKKMANASTPCMSSSSATLWGKNNANLIRSDKKSAKKLWNYQDYWKYRFTSVINNQPHPMCFEILATDSMKHMKHYD